MSSYYCKLVTIGRARSKISMALLWLELIDLVRAIFINAFAVLTYALTFSSPLS